MNDLNSLQAMGLTMPSASYWVGMIMFSIIGYAAYRYGKKRETPVTKWLGVALMLYGYLVSDELWMWLTGLVLCLGLYLYRGE